MEPPSLTEPLASRFAAIALRHVAREYPNNLIHTLDGPEDARTPRVLALLRRLRLVFVRLWLLAHRRSGFRRAGSRSAPCSARS